MISLNRCDHISKNYEGWAYIVDKFICCKKCLEETSGYVDYHAAEMSFKGASLGGVARAKKLSPERRKEIASKAAKARWASQ